MNTALRATYRNGERRRRAILRYLLRLERREVVAPTLRELCDVAGLASPSSVWEYLHAFRRRGLVTMGQVEARAVRLTPAGVLAAQGYRLLWQTEDL